MKMLELFCGNKNISNAFKEIGFDVYTVDWDEKLNPTLVADISKLTVDDIISLCDGKPDVVWASPDCTTYSVAAIYRHRRKDALTGKLLPCTEYAEFCDKCNIHVSNMLRELNPTLWFVENPRGGFRNMGFYPNELRHTVTYCQYGDFRQKPTDIWTNHPDPGFKPPCHRGDPCHEAAPRGASTGSTRLSKKQRSNIPKELCEHIAQISYEYLFYE